MEALGSAATVFAVVSIADQLADRVKQLYSFWSAVSEAPDKIQAIASDVNLVLSIVTDISSHEQKYGIDALMTDALKNCLGQVEKLLQITTTLQASILSSSRSRRKLGAIKAVFKDDKIREFSVQLEAVKSTLVLSQQRALSKLSHLHFDARQQATAQIVQSVLSLSTEESKQAIQCIQSLYLADYFSKLKSIPSREPGTCEWVVNDPAFKNWSEASLPPLLWLSGNPGCGKTVISSFLISSDVLTMRGKMIYFICDNKNINLRTKESLIRSLLHQLISATPVLVRHAIPYYLSMKDSISTSSATLWNIFETILNDENLPRTYCIVDGLDECDLESRQWLLAKLNHIQGASKTFKMIVTSRPWEEIEFGLRTASKIRLKSEERETKINHDIAKFVNTSMKELAERRGYPSSLEKEVIKTLIDKANGMFLWVSLILTDLEGVSTRDVTKHLSELPEGLYELYDSILARIKPSAASGVQRILTWIVTANYPLTLMELAIASNLDNIKSSRNADPAELLRSIRGDIKLCGPILTVRYQQVHLVHQSAKDFFQAQSQYASVSSQDLRYQIEASNSNALLAEMCLEYLCLEELELFPILDSKPHLSGFRIAKSLSQSFETRMQDLPFLSYSVNYWPWHFERCPGMESRVLASVRKLIDKPQNFSAWFQMFFFFDQEESNWWSSSGATPLHIATYLGILPVLQLVLDHLEPDLNEKDYWGETPLLWAVNMLGSNNMAAEQRSRQEAVIRALLTAGANVDETDILRATPLHESCALGMIHIIPLLIEAGADINVRDCYGKSPIHVASKLIDVKDCLQVVGILNENGANLNTVDNDGNTALLIAIDRREEVSSARALEEQAICSIVSLLASSGANLNQANSVGHTPLLSAARLGRWKVVSLLASKGADVNAKDENGDYTLLLACRAKKWDISSLLVEKGAYIHDSNKDGESGISLGLLSGENSLIRSLIVNCKKSDSVELSKFVDMAAGNGQEDVVQQIMDLFQDHEYPQSLATARLFLTVRRGDHTTVQQIFEENVTLGLSVRDSLGQGLLHLAVKSCNLSLVELISTKTDMINTTDNLGGTPLHLAASNGDEKIMLYLLKRGADKNAQTSRSRLSVLCTAAYFGHLAAVCLLLEWQADMETGDTDGATPLMNAAMNDHSEIVSVLLEKGASINTKAGSTGSTALHYAVLHNQVSVVERLLKSGAKTDLKYASGRTSLHLAAFKGRLPIVKLLISNDKSILEIKDDQGWTALMSAVLGGRGEVFRYLVEQGADMRTTDNSGRTAFYRAIRKGRTGVVFTSMLRGLVPELESESNELDDLGEVFTDSESDEEAEAKT